MFICVISILCFDEVMAIVCPDVCFRQFVSGPYLTIGDYGDIVAFVGEYHKGTILDGCV